MSVMPFLLGLAALIKGADWLVEGASSLARRMNVPDVVIGLTLVSFGTSVAELFVNLTASVQGGHAIIIGNILGSNIFNATVILGTAALIVPLSVKDNTVWKEIPMGVLAAVVFWVMVSDPFLDGADAAGLSRGEGVILLLFFAVFLSYTISLAFQHRRLFEQQAVYQDPYPKAILCIIVGLVCLIVGGRWVVAGAVDLARLLGVSEGLIALTIVAAGTSLPELVTSTVAALQKKPDIAVANVVGSNIFNIFFILGISAVIHPVPFSGAGHVDAMMCIITSLLMFIWMFTLGKNKFDRPEAAVMIVLYVGYLLCIIFRG